MATALVTLALLGVRDRALTLGQVHARARAAAGLPHRARAAALGRRAARPRPACGGCSAALAEQNVVTVYEGGEEPVYAIERGQHLVAAFYRNSAIHHVVDRAIAELVMLREPGATAGRRRCGCATS